MRKYLWLFFVLVMLVSLIDGGFLALAMSCVVVSASVLVIAVVIGGEK